MGVKFSISPLFFVVGFSMWWIGAFTHFLALLVAVLVHELVHIIAARHFGVKVERLKLLPFGAQIDIDVGFLPKEKRTIILLAGIFGNIIFTIIFFAFLWMVPGIFIWFEKLVLANAVVVVMNLLPFWPLDGGKLVGLGGGGSSFVSRFKQRQKQGRIIEVAVLPSMTLFDVYKLVSRSNYTKFIMGDRSFYESDLEHWLGLHDIGKTLGDVMDR